MKNSWPGEEKKAIHKSKKKENRVRGVETRGA